MIGYMLAKKNSMHSLAISLANKPGVGDSVGLHGGLLIPFNRLWTFADKLVCRCVSRSSLITFALEPLGPFFCGIALYVQVNCAEEQLRQGLMPSHLTFRRWQASQALFTACDILNFLYSCLPKQIDLNFDFGRSRRRHSFVTFPSPVVPNSASNLY